MKATMRIVLVTLLVSAAFAQRGEDDPFNPDEKWCGDENCYDVLNVDKTKKPLTNTAKRSEIKKRYRELSLTQHPDKFTAGSPEQKVQEEVFKKIARANEILTKSSRRKLYDQYLSMKKQMDSPKESPVMVLILMLLVTFFIVHMWNIQSYEKMRKSIVSHKEIENHIAENAEGKSRSVKNKRKKSIKERRKGKSTLEDDEFQYSDEQISAALAATDTFWPGWNGKPTYITSAIATLWLPVLFTTLTLTNLRWMIQYGIFRQEYSDSDCEYLCYTEAELGPEAWNMLTNEQKIQYLSKKDRPYNKRSLIQSLTQDEEEEKDESGKKEQ